MNALRASVCAAAGGLLLQGCLPRHALTRRDELEADLYTLSLTVDVTTEGLDLPPFTYALDGEVAWSYTRSFRDGSMGHLLRFPTLRGQVRRGDTTVDIAVPFSDAIFELRGFPDGEVLTVAGAPRWSADAGHLEVLDVLWPALSPHVPPSRAEAEAFTSSWPAWVSNGPRVRQRLVARWTSLGDDRWAYAGALRGEGGNVTTTGDAAGEVELGTRLSRLVAHRFTGTRTTRTRWAAGAEVAQTFVVRGSLARYGAAPAPPLDMPIGEDDASADALPLRLRDGRTVEEPASAGAPDTPFVFLPDDLPAEERAALRAPLVGAW